MNRPSRTTLSPLPAPSHNRAEGHSARPLEPSPEPGLGPRPGPAGAPVAPPTLERCLLLLRQWRAHLQLSAREQNLLGPELASLDRQLQRLEQRHLRLAVFGRVGVGKSSLLNALLEQERFATDVAHGCTRRQEGHPWDEPIAGPHSGLRRVELVDTPGIDEIGAAGRARLAARVALGADLVLLVLDGDLSRLELEALTHLRASGQPLLLVLNRSDAWPPEELQALQASIRRRLPAGLGALEPIAVAAAPHQACLLPDGRVRSRRGTPRIAPLRQRLLSLLEQQGETLLALHTLRAADRFNQTLHRHRLRQGRRQAQALIGRFAALKAGGVAASPLPLLDLAGAMAIDSALVLQLCQLYDLPMTQSGARQLLAALGGQNALLGSVQLLLGGLRQLLLLAAPLSGGLSLAPAAPVAVAQAALAVATTRRTGRLAALALLRNATAAGQPGALLKRLAQQDPSSRAWLYDIPGRHPAGQASGVGGSPGEAAQRADLVP